MEASPLADRATRMRFNKTMREKGIPAKGCPKCFMIKGYEGFAVQRGKPDGRQADCRTCRNEATHRWYIENQERSAEKARRWRDEHPKRHADTGRRWREANRERRAEATGRWQQANPEKVRATKRHYQALRRARLKAATIVPFTYAEMLRHWEDLDLYGCAFCGGPYEDIEHIVPLSRGGERGGEHSLDNIVPSCRDCNRGVGGKHSRDPWEWLAERFPNLAPILLPDVDE